MLYNPTMSTPIDHDLPVSDGLFPIRHVCAETGINPVTLRAWERRYGLIRPLRTPKGHRLYSAQDIARIHRILALLGEGVAVSQVGRVLEHEAQTRARSGATREPSLMHGEPAPTELQGGVAPHTRDPIAETLLETTRSLRTVDLERSYARLVMRHGWVGVHQHAFLETYNRLREGARHDPRDEARLAVFTAWAANSLFDQLHAALLLCEGPTCPCIVPAGGHRRLDGLVLMLAAARQGLRVLPLQDIISPAAMDNLTERYKSPGIAVHASSRSLQGNELERLQRLLRAEGVPAFLAGAGAPALAELQPARPVVILPPEPLDAADRLSRQLLGTEEP